MRLQALPTDAVRSRLERGRAYVVRNLLTFVATSRVAVRGGPFLCAAKKFRVTCIRFTL